MKRLFVVIFLSLAASVYESEAIAGGEGENTQSNLVFLSYQRSIQTGITMEIVEENGEKHRLEHMQTYRWSPLDSEYNTLAYLALALRGGDGLIRYLWLPMIERVEKLSADQYKVTLTDGRSLKGKWEPAHEIYYYHESKDPRIVGLVMQEDQQRWAYLSAKHIKSLTIDTTSGPDLKALLDQNLPKTHLVVQFKDGRIFQGPGHIVDYCGHWSSTTWHQRLWGSLLYWNSDVTQADTISNRPQSVPVEKLQEIQLTGKFGKNLPHAREARLRLTDGTEKQVFLELTSESYGGNEYHSEAYRRYDSCLLFQEYGALALPLDSIQTIAVKHEQTSAPNTTSFTIPLHGGLNFLHVPVADSRIQTVADLFKALGPDGLLVIYYDTTSSQFLSYFEPFHQPTDAVNIALQPYTGLIAVMKPDAKKEVTFEGPASLDPNVPLVKGKDGLNLIGLPKKEKRIQKFSDLVGLNSHLIRLIGQNDAGELKVYPGEDLPIRGGQSFAVSVDANTTLELSGQPWENSGTLPNLISPTVSVDGQTPVLAVYGAVVDQVTGLAKEGFRVTVKNLSTGASLNAISGSDTSEGRYSVTFVNLTSAPAARVGDVLEITAQTPSPLIGVQPLRHTVSTEDVRASQIRLPNLMASEMTKETTYSLAVNSVPKGVTIPVSPADHQGHSDGTAPFSREYNRGTSATLKAPSTFGTQAFSHWDLDGENKGTDLSMTVTMDANHMATAHYKPTTGTNLLIVEGVIREKGGRFAEAGLSVTVTVGNHPPQSTLTGDNGNYVVTFFNPLEVVAESGETVEVRASRITGESAVSTVVLTAQQIDKNHVTVDVSLNKPAFDLALPEGISLTHMPLKVTAVGDKPMELKSISNLYDALGGAKNVNVIITRDSTVGVWRSYLGPQSQGTAADPALTDNLGLITVMKNPVTLRLKGGALGTNGTARINLVAGTNLIGVPLKDARLKRVSDLLSLSGIKDNATAIIVSDNGEFKVVAQPGEKGDISIIGGQAFIITTRAAGVAEVTGEAWDNVSSGVSAAPPLTKVGHEVSEQTPVLVVHGAVVDEGRGLAKEGFRVTVKNLSTGTSLSTLSGGDAAEGSLSLTFVDALSSRAARVGDVLEITAQTPSPFIGVQPLRHVVSPEEVKASQIRFPNLIAYEIPKETQLRQNYPNPFNPETWIPYRLASDASVTLTLYDTTGRMIRIIKIGHQRAGVYESKDKAIYWDGRNDLGERVANGVYFYSLIANDFTTTRKMLILK